VHGIETRQHPSFRGFVKRHAVLTYFILVFALSWGLPFIIVLVSPGAFLGAGAATSVADYLALGPLPYVGLLTGALSPALAGILVITVASGRAGLRDLRSRFRWQVGVRWYAVALLTVPLLWTAILAVFSLTSRAFLPGIITAEDNSSLLVAGLVLGLIASFFEEIGWTGFATPELRKRHGGLATGLIIGLPWCVLHAPLYATTGSGGIPPALYVPVMAFSILLPYRVLMVWVYDRTQSVLMAILMHLMLIVWPFVLPGSPAMVGVPDLIFNLVVGATLWVVVAAVAAADRTKLLRGEHRRTTTARHVV
jgi:membrane protease YdiL (CAAX protease family)